MPASFAPSFSLPPKIKQWEESASAAVNRSMGGLFKPCVEQKTEASPWKGLTRPVIVKCFQLLAVGIIAVKKILMMREGSDNLVHCLTFWISSSSGVTITISSAAIHCRCLLVSSHRMVQQSYFVPRHPSSCTRTCAFSPQGIQRFRR